MQLVATKQVNELAAQVGQLREENGVLKAVINQTHSQQALILSKIEDVLDQVTQTSAGVTEVKTTEFYGKKASFLPQAVDQVEKYSNQTIRDLIHKAARAHEGGRRKGYTYIYNKLIELTGINVYEIGQLRLKESDGIEGWKKDPSYINTILVKGIQKEAAVIAKEMLIRK